MKFSKTFSNRVLKKDGSGAVIATGDPLDLVLRDRSVVTVTASGVGLGGKRVWWNVVGNESTYQPRSEDVISVNSNHQLAAPVDANYHDGPEDSGSLPPVIQGS